MFGYGKARRIVSNATEVQPPPSLTAATADDGVHHILRLTSEVVTDGIGALGLCKMVGDVVCWHVRQRGCRQGNVPASALLLSAEWTRYSLRFLSRRYDTRGRSVKVVRVAGSVNRFQSCQGGFVSCQC